MPRTVENFSLKKTVVTSWLLSGKVDEIFPSLKARLVYAMAIRVVEFSSGGYKIGKSFAKKSTYSKEIIEF